MFQLVIFQLMLNTINTTFFCYVYPYLNHTDAYISCHFFFSFFLLSLQFYLSIVYVMF